MPTLPTWCRRLTCCFGESGSSLVLRPFPPFVRCRLSFVRRVRRPQSGATREHATPRASGLPTYPPAKQPEGATRRGAFNAEAAEFRRHGDGRDMATLVPSLIADGRFARTRNAPAAKSRVARLRARRRRRGRCLRPRPPPPARPPLRVLAAASARTRACGATRKRASLSSIHERASPPSRRFADRCVSPERDGLGTWTFSDKRRAACAGQGEVRGRLLRVLCDLSLRPVQQMF